MIAVAILLAGAAVGFGLARWLRVPQIPLLLLVGVVMATLGVLPEFDLLQDVVILGLAFLVFVAGIELNPRRIRVQRVAALRVGFVQFWVMALLGGAAALALQYDLATSLFIGFALSASSTLVVVRLLQQRQQMFEPFGRLVIGVLLLQDLLIILLIPVLTRLRDGVQEVLAGMGAVLLLVALAWICLRWIVPPLVDELGLDEESLLLVALAFLFIFSGAAILLDLPLVAGAFLAGISLSGFPASSLVRTQLSSLSDFFLAIFFTALGAFVIPPSGLVLAKALALALVVMVATPPLVAFVAERSGLAARPALEGGLLLAQTSELSLLIGLQGWDADQISGEIFTVIALVTVLTMILTPFLASNRMTWRLLRLHPTRHTPLLSQAPRDHVLLLGCGDYGMPLLETLLGTGLDVLVVDEDPAVIDRLRDGDVPCILGDGSDFQVLETARASEARVIVSTMRRPRDSRNVLKHVRGVPTLVRVFEPAEADMIRAQGGIPVLYSEAAAEDFLSWLEQAESVGLEQERRQRPRHL